MRRSFDRARHALRGVRRGARKRWLKVKSVLGRTWAGVTALVLFLGALVTVLALAPGEVSSAWHTLGGGGGGEGSAEAWADLVVERPPVLTNGEAQRASAGPRTRWKRSTMPQVDLTLRNEGDGRIVLGRARIEVLASDRITSCLPPQGEGGGIPVAESIFVDLPLFPLPEEQVVYQPLHREIPPHHTTRIKLYFRSLDYENADDLFALDVSLLGAEPGQRTEVGRFVVGVPSAVPRYSFYVPESTETMRTAARYGEGLPTTWCFRRNLAVVHRFLAMRGRRSPSMSSLAFVRPPPGWSQAADGRAPAAAAGPLMRTGDFYVGPALAVFAAERSGAGALVRRTRREAAAELSREIEADLTGDPPTPHSAVADARTLLTLTDSDEARSLVGRSEAALRQSETELEGLGG